MKLYDNHPLWDALDESFKEGIKDTIGVIIPKDMTFEDSAYIDYVELIIEKHCEIVEETVPKGNALLANFILFFILKLTKDFDFSRNQYPSDYLISLLNSKDAIKEATIMAIKLLRKYMLKDDHEK